MLGSFEFVKSLIMGMMPGSSHQNLREKRKIKSLKTNNMLTKHKKNKFKQNDLLEK
jgi:hypothetical protein